MLNRPNMPNFVVDISNYTNGANNTYNFTTSSPLPHFTGDLLYFAFPVEIRLRTPLECIPMGVLKAIYCKRIGNFLVEANMTFYNDFIEVNTTI